MSAAFYFQAPISRFYQVIRSEYDRLSRRLAGEQPFSIQAAKWVNSPPPPDYRTVPGEEMLLTFWVVPLHVAAVSVDVEAAYDGRQTQLTVQIETEAHEPRGRSALAMWQDEVLPALQQTGLLKRTLPRLPKTSRGPQFKTRIALQRLREIRLAAIQNHRPIPKKDAAMDEVEITDKTWSRYDPELWSRWYDKDYRWENPEKPEIPD